MGIDLGPPNNFNKTKPFFKPGPPNNDRNYNNNSSKGPFVKRMPENSAKPNQNGKKVITCYNCKKPGNVTKDCNLKRV